MHEVPRYYLCLHGVGKPDREFEPGEERFWIEPWQLDDLIALKKALQPEVNIILSFDDANVSDHGIVAERLEQGGISATFYVLAEMLGIRSYMERRHLRALVDAGHIIGSHGLHHVDWRSVDAVTLRSETHDSKAMLEDILGCAVTKVAMPYGSYDRRVLASIKAAGYERIFSCDGGPRLFDNGPFQPRLAIERTHTPAYLERRIRRDLGKGARTVQEARIFAKGMRGGSVRNLHSLLPLANTLILAA